ncbi:MAG: hypothetical protein JST61_09065 [Acidobacteria bacterium]|nr:hypothetical protein [Acidobacteriota bacterium]
MKPQSYLAGTLVIAASLLSAPAQTTDGAAPLIASTSVPSRFAMEARDASAEGVIRPMPARPPRTWRPFAALGVATHVGINGAGFDLAVPVARKLNVRTGTDFFSYAFSFQEEGADINAAFRLRSGHAALDWFPFGGRFRISPLMVFANNNQVHATAVIPSGSSLSLNGQDYISSYADPLHGSGTVSFRKAAPGLSLGFGNMVPRTRGHVSFPLEAGFYYVGQPSLKVDFAGSACDPNYPADIGCQPVMQDTGFQKDLASFIVRNNHNLSYASIFPIFSIGFSYSFGGGQGRVR